MSRTAWVESPLQLINAIEYAHATGDHLDISVRQGVPQVARTMIECEPRLPPGVTVRLASAGASAPRLLVARRLLAGDVFSGFIRAALSGGAVRDLVLVDDGAASLHLAAVLQSGRALTRARRTEPSWLRWLGARARGALRRCASAGKLEIFTVYAEAFEALAEPRLLVRRNEYAWARGAFDAQADLGGSVILGSALAADGMISEGEYLGWIRSHVPPAGVSYLPHRRERAISLGVIDSIPGVVVVRTDLPVEVILAAPNRVADITCLPSSVVATLRTILEPSTCLNVEPVPDLWFTSKATGDLKEVLARVVARDMEASR